MEVCQQGFVYNTGMRSYIYRLLHSPGQAKSSTSLHVSGTGDARCTAHMSALLLEWQQEPSNPGAVPQAAQAGQLQTEEDTMSVTDIIDVSELKQ